MGPCRNCGEVLIFDGHRLREPHRAEWNTLPGYIQLALIKTSRMLAAERRKRLKAKEPVPITAPLKCPRCAVPFDNALCQNASGDTPGTGCMGLCKRCGEMLVFESSTVIRSAGPLEMARAPRELSEWSKEIKAMRKQN